MKNLLAFLVLLGGWSALHAADDPPAGGEPKDESARAVAALKLAKAEADRYRLKLDGDRPAAEMLADPVLQWSNPVVGSFHGAVFLWTDRGCPVAVASIYYKFLEPMPHLGAEFHTLTPKLQEAERIGVPTWFPGTGAPERRPIVGAPRPAESPAARLRQLRALAAGFSATQTTRENVVRELRLLTQPVFRYASTDPDVIDGGVFAFVQGTDPEIILVIEARRTPAGSEWQFAAARMNSLSLTMKSRGTEVWSAPTITWNQAQDHRQPYTLFIIQAKPEF